MLDKVTGFFKKNKNQYKEEILKHVTEEFERRQKERLPLELNWRLNIEFYNGNQWQQVNTQTNNIEEISTLYWWQEREHFNQIAPIVETRLAKLSRLRPIPKVRPATDQDDDISNAKVSTKLVESTYYDQKMKEKQLTANVWSELTGTAIYKTIWNPQKGRTIGTYVNEEEGQEQEITEGDIETIVISPFEIYPDSIWNQDVDDCKSIIHAKAYNVSEIKDLWGIDVKGSEVNVFTIKSNGNLFNFGGNNGYRVATQKKKNNAIVYEYWEKPSSMFPKGRIVICTNDEILHIGELPYQVGEADNLGFPFKTQKSVLVPGCFFGKSIIERLIPLQRRYNALKNRKAEYLTRCSIGQIVAEEGTVDLDFLEKEGNAPGVIIEYQRGARPPQYVQFHALPSTFESEEQNLLGDFIRISGVSELSRDSSAPAGINGSGRALQILQENDETRLSLSASYITESMIQIAKFWLRLYKQFADIPRIIRCVGKGDEVSIVEWDKNTITSDDIYIEAHSQTIESSAQRRQMVFDLIGMGLFNDPITGRLSQEGLNKVFEMIELGNWENGNDITQLHEEKAQRENKLIVNGNMPMPTNYDNDEMHIAIHNKYRLTVDYEELLAQNPQLEEIFDQHLMLHIQNMQSKIIPQEQELQGGQNETI